MSLPNVFHSNALSMKTTKNSSMYKIFEYILQGIYVQMKFMYNNDNKTWNGFDLLPLKYFTTQTVKFL